MIPIIQDGAVAFFSPSLNGRAGCGQSAAEAASIPFYAILPSKSSNKPILLDGLRTSPALIVQAFYAAGPSGARRKDSSRRADNEQTQVSRSNKLSPTRRAHELSWRGTTFRDADSTRALMFRRSTEIYRLMSFINWGLRQYLPRESIWHGLCHAPIRPGVQRSHGADSA